MAVYNFATGLGTAGTPMNGLGSTTEVFSGATVTQPKLDLLVAALHARGNTIVGIDGAIGGTMHLAVQGGPAVGSATYGTVVCTAICTFEAEH